MLPKRPEIARRPRCVSAQQHPAPWRRSRSSCAAGPGRPAPRAAAMAPQQSQQAEGLPTAAEVEARVKELEQRAMAAHLEAQQLNKQKRFDGGWRQHGTAPLPVPPLPTRLASAWGRGCAAATPTQSDSRPLSSLPKPRAAPLLPLCPGPALVRPRVPKPTRTPLTSKTTPLLTPSQRPRPSMMRCGAWMPRPCASPTPSAAPAAAAPSPRAARPWRHPWPGARRQDPSTPSCSGSCRGLDQVRTRRQPCLAAGGPHQTCREGELRCVSNH
jgi:hypothetical protein